MKWILLGLVCAVMLMPTTGFADAADAHYRLAKTLRSEGKYKEALQAYNRALSIKPDYAQALEYRGKAHIRLGNKKAALADYQKLVKMGSPLAEDLKEAIDKMAKN